MLDNIYNVLFLCNRNAARSLVAESVLDKEGGGRFRAFSAGSQPAGEVHPMVLDLLRNYHYPIEGLRSKSWDEFATQDAPVMDFIFTVCDDSAGEICPLWPGQPISAHWVIPDPALVKGSDLDREIALTEALRYVRTRVDLFKALPMEALDAASLRAQLDDIGKAKTT